MLLRKTLLILYEGIEQKRCIHHPSFTFIQAENSYSEISNMKPLKNVFGSSSINKEISVNLRKNAIYQIHYFKNGFKNY